MNGNRMSTAVLLLLVHVLPAAHADPRSDLPIPATYDPGRAASKVEHYRIRPFQAEFLEFQIGLPAGWTDATPIRPFEERYDRPVALGHWYEPSKEGRPAHVEVSYLLLPFAVASEQWLEVEARRLGWTVVARKAGTLRERHVAEILATAKPGDGEWVVRWSAIQDAERMFLVAAAAPAERYVSLAHDLAAPILTFQICATRAITGLSYGSWSVTIPFAAELPIPGGWTIAPHPAASGASLLRLTDPEADEDVTLDWQIDDAAAARTDGQAIAAAVQRARDLGFGADPTSWSTPLRVAGLPSGTFAILADQAQRRMELRVVTLATRTGRATLSALSPARSADQASWRLARQLVDDMVERLRFPE